MLIPYCLKPLANIAPDEHHRYAVTGVQVSRQPDGKCWAVATNGMILIAAEWETKDGEEPFACVVPAFFWKRAFWVAKSWREPVHLKVDDKRIELLVSHGSNKASFSCRPVEGKFPAWQEILAKFKTTAYATPVAGPGKYVRARLSSYRILQLMEAMTPLADLDNDKQEWDFPVTPDESEWSVNPLRVKTTMPLDTGKVIVYGVIMPLGDEKR